MPSRVSSEEDEVTPDQLSAIRARLDGGLQPLPSQGYALLDEVERLTAWQVAVADGLGYLNHAEGQGGYEVAEPETVIGAWREQEREVERLTNDLALARQVSGELCEACGWAMKFPGEMCRCELLKEVERLTSENARLRLAVPRIIHLADPEADRAFDAMQPSFGTPVPPERRIRRQADVNAAFARGAEAMRESAAQLVHREVEGWMQLGLSGDIRALPIPEDKS
jgi:hypothetical protein